MDQQKVNMYLVANQKYFPEDKIFYLREKLESADESKFAIVSSISLKDPTTILLCSLLVGGIGVDRFLIGDTGMGILKLLTFGCCGILTIVDWFGTYKKAKEINFNKVMTMI